LFPNINKDRQSFMTFVLTFVDNVRTRIVRVGFFLYFEIIIEHVWIEEIKKKL